MCLLAWLWNCSSASASASWTVGLWHEPLHPAFALILEQSWNRWCLSLLLGPIHTYTSQAHTYLGPNSSSAGAHVVWSGWITVGKAHSLETCELNIACFVYPSVVILGIMSWVSYCCWRSQTQSLIHSRPEVQPVSYSFLWMRLRHIPWDCFSLLTLPP